MEYILNACLDQLRKLPPVKSTKINKSSASKNTDIDAILNIATDRGDTKFAVEVKGVLKRPLPHPKERKLVPHGANL